MVASSALSTSPANGFTRDPSSVYAKNVDEADMRGGCPKAAFGEDLYVSATATNGWVRLSGLDASAVPTAFALEPKNVDPVIDAWRTRLHRGAACASSQSVPG